MTIKRNPSSGFTLIEIIITLVIASILGVVIYQYLGSSLVRSSEPIFRLQKTLSLKQVAENINADHKNKIYTANLPELKTKIGSPGAGDYDNEYGKYRVVENKYISFTSNNESAPTDEKMLKVTIQNDQNETITMIFISA